MTWRARQRHWPVISSTGRITLPWLLRLAVCFSFLAAFLQYELSVAATGFLPLVTFGVCALLVLSGRQRAERMQHILSGGGLLFAAMLFGEVISYTSHDSYSLYYGLAFIGLFLCMRLIVQEIGIPNVMRAYSQAAVLTVCIILISGRQTLFAGETSRFSGGTRAHPNLLGFVLAGYFPVLVWRAIEERITWRKRILVGLSIAAFGMVFLSGSRGSLTALLATGAILVLRGVAAGWLGKFRLRHLHIIAFLILVPVAVVFLVSHNRIGHIADYVVDFLALNTTQRGLKSGLSGRTGIWHIAFRLLRTHGRWLFGFGYRAGDRLVGTIDNGYVQLLFESGLVAGGLIFGSMIRAFLLLWKASSCRLNTAWNRYYLVLWCLMIVYFLNNISTRYLFSFGSPFSLCILFLVSASRRELVGNATQVRVSEKAPNSDRVPKKSVWDEAIVRH